MRQRDLWLGYTLLYFVCSVVVVQVTFVPHSEEKTAFGTEQFSHVSPIHDLAKHVTILLEDLREKEGPQHCLESLCFVSNTMQCFISGVAETIDVILERYQPPEEFREVRLHTYV